MISSAVHYRLLRLHRPYSELGNLSLAYQRLDKSAEPEILK